MKIFATLALLGLVSASPIGLSSPSSESDVRARDLTTEKTTLTTQGRTATSYTGYLNGGSFQQNGIVSYGKYEYAVFWDNAGFVNVARRAPSSLGGSWNIVNLTDYQTTSTDSHNTISLGICQEDNTIHLSFDMHATQMRYRRSVVGAANADSWAASTWEAVQTSLGGSTASQLTYPTFVDGPNGILQLSIREGTAGNGNELLFEYTNGEWTYLGPYLAGIGDSVNPYLFGLLYDDSGRLHTAWTVRYGGDPTTNQDIYYAYSDDKGRTWHSQTGADLGTVGSAPINSTLFGAKAIEIPQNRGLINQESMIVDSQGFVHIIASHLPTDLPDNSDWTAARSDAVLVHYYLDPTEGTAGQGNGWYRQFLDVYEGVLRADVGIDSNDNLYVVSGDSVTKVLRIMSATKASEWTQWSDGDVLDAVYDSDPLLDRVRLRQDGIATVFAVRTGGAQIDVVSWLARTV